MKKDEGDDEDEEERLEEVKASLLEFLRILLTSTKHGLLFQVRGVV